MRLAALGLASKAVCKEMVLFSINAGIVLSVYIHLVCFQVLRYFSLLRRDFKLIYLFITKS